jgi:hypothetical protein
MLGIENEGSGPESEFDAVDLAWRHGRGRRPGIAPAHSQQFIAQQLHDETKPPGCKDSGN